VGSWARCSTGEGRNRRSLHFATPDFLLRLVALANFMRLSSLKAAHAVASCAAWQEIRVRSGPASTLYGTVTFSLSSRPERSGAEGPAVSFSGPVPSLRTTQP